MVEEFSVRVLLRDEEIAVLRVNYESINEKLIRCGNVPYESFEQYLGMIADAACKELAVNILEAAISGVEI